MNNKTRILMMATEVRETKDNKEAALMLQSGNWITVGAAFQGNDILWVLTKVDQDYQIPALRDNEGQHQPNP